MEQNQRAQHKHIHFNHLTFDKIAKSIHWKETILKMVQGTLNVSMCKNDPYQSPSTTLTLNESNS